MQIDGVDFNMEWVKKQTEKKFVEHPMHRLHFTHLREEEKKKLLKQIYRMTK